MSSLDVLYKELDFKTGALLTATDEPSSCQKRSDWLEKGEWLSAAKRAGAEKIFFVENNPVAVFAECGDGTVEKVRAFNKAWCLARPRLFFLASPGDITVYDLAQRPVDENKPKEWKKLKTLAVLDDIKEVSSKLQEFHRDNIESGRIFGDERFGDLKNRADKALIWDLKVVRRELIAAGLSDDNARFAHALIGRSIFIRYLEDRGVLDKDYFLKVARQKAGWTDLLRKCPARSGLDASEKKTYYPRALADKAFTYALFRTLARDFNGDIFPEIDEEESVVSSKHLQLIQDLLYGDVGIEKQLFFYSYRFDIIPLDLISSIYEEFYHYSTNDDEKKDKARQDGAYYTPSVLAEFVLSRVLTPTVIKKKPRVLDPACGSGIFLVEAFRRIVRYEWHRKKEPLTFGELKEILKNQIAGIEVNEEAARITAFSLYLSMLHYLDPPAIDRQIKQGNKLPYLLATKSRSQDHYHCILGGVNAFDVDKIESSALWRERFGDECAHIIVGNPPWGKPGPKADAKTKARHKTMVDWCKKNSKSIGDQEASQAFLWRAVSFLKPNGKAGMLVSAGVLFKHSTTTQAFRKQWMNSVKLDEVFNFAHVRKFFFNGAISPFLSVFFDKSLQDDRPVRYWSAKQTAILKETQTVLLSLHDLKILREKELYNNALWKTCWLGSFADREFMQWLKRKKLLSVLVDRENSGRGYQTYSKENPAEELKKFKKTLKKISSRYEELSFSDPPEKSYNLGPLGAYAGFRVLVNEGISEKADRRGQIIARYADEPFSFYRSIYGVRLCSQDKSNYRLLLGILWSSLARYYFFMTSSNWGLWHHKILLDELYRLPVVLDEASAATRRVISVVEKLRDYHPQGQDVIHPDGIPEEQIEDKRTKMEAQLDEAVYELYGLNEEQKDLIRDCCEVTLPFFYKPFDSVGAMKAVEDNDYSWIENYVNVFSRRWNTYLDDSEEMRAEVHVGAHGNMVAVEFYPADKGDLWDMKPKNDSWGYVLEQIGNSLPQPMGTSQILLDGVVHAVSENGVIIIKRNEKRFWTRSLAREDADATLCKRMVDTSPAKERDR